MAAKKHRVAIIGCGSMGEHYAKAYSTYPDVELVAIAEYNEDRRREMGEQFGVSALYRDEAQMLKEIVPDVAAIVTSTRYMKDAAIACAQAGVKGISVEKPMAAKLSDADEMVEVCRERGVVFAGGNLQRAMHEVQEAAARLRAGEFGLIEGASIHGNFGLQLSGAGCQEFSVLRLFTNAEVENVLTWAHPPEALASDSDTGLVIWGQYELTNGIHCPVLGPETPFRGIDVWTEDSLIRWIWKPPEIYRGFDENGRRVPIDPGYRGYEFSEFGYLTGSIRSLLKAVETGSEPWISGHDLRQALELAIASKLSAQLGSVPVKLPLSDRSLSLLPSEGRWLGKQDGGRRVSE
jgi:predicted dehydrogenase